MPKFPSVDWFESVREAANQDAQFTSQGSCDCNMAAIVGDKAFLIGFEGFKCTSVKEIDKNELYEADFYLDMVEDDWKRLLENIRANGGADSDHTLNTLDLLTPGAS